MAEKSQNLDVTTFDRVPPHNVEAEQALLGSMLISADAISAVIEIVHTEDFYSEAHRLIYNAMSGMYVDGEPIDSITLSENLKSSAFLERVGGKSLIHSLANMVPTAASAVHYANIVSRNATLRGLIRAATEIATIGYEAPEDVERAVDEAESLIFAISNKRVSEEFVQIKQPIIDNYEHIEKLAQNKSDVTGLSTGFRDFDIKTAGLQKSDLIVLAARPSMGKTALALSIAQHVAVKENKAVAIFSLEMSRHQLAQRLLAAEARIDAQAIRTGKIRDEDWQKLQRAMDRLVNAPIHIDDSAGITIMELRAKARRLMAKEKLELIIVDYLQLMSGRSGSENRQQEISEISRALKVLGRELQVPVIAVSQLSRAVEARDNKRPKLSDLRESGAIEQDADLVVFIYRDAYYNSDNDDNITEIIIAKHRNGPTGMIQLSFVDTYAKFEDLVHIKSPSM